MTTALLEGTALRFTIGAAVLVDDVDLTVGNGELVAVIGPNGAGKSTLLSVLSGDVRPQHGSVRIAGRDTRSMGPLEMARSRAVVRQHLASDVPFTVRQVVEMGRHPLQVTGATDAATDAARVAELLRAVDLGDRAHLPLSALSGGEQRRVALARVLAQEAPLLLLDEPAAALDVAHQELTMRLLRDRVAAMGGALAILHDLNLAASHADRVVIMHRGRVRASGTPAEVMTAEVLTDVYTQRLEVKPHPTRDRPLVIVVD